MSEDSKNLSDDLNEMLDDAKESAQNVGKKISSSTKEFTEDAKEKTKEFSDNAKRTADEFSRDAEKAFSDGKNVAIIAHITLIGWIIALVMNSSNKTEFGSFYIRQVLGIILLALVLSIIPFVNLIGWILALVMWIMSLISSLNGEMKPVFLLGDKFQDWFKGL
ncbi:MAG: YtxH domain-containing protein [Bacteroidota bacterium]|mgnify:CR=1 FL=1